MLSWIPSKNTLLSFKRQENNIRCWYFFLFHRLRFQCVWQDGWLRILANDDANVGQHATDEVGCQNISQNVKSPKLQQLSIFLLFFMLLLLVFLPLRLDVLKATLILDATALNNDVVLHPNQSLIFSRQYILLLPPFLFPFVVSQMTSQMVCTILFNANRIWLDCCNTVKQKHLDFSQCLCSCSIKIIRNKVA